jgi:tetratricopeptide (TPR) repeat protein
MFTRYKINVNGLRHAALLACMLVLMLPMVSCSPIVSSEGVQSANPIDILERSPRVYHVDFEALADSIETTRASAYLTASIARELAMLVVDTIPAADPTPRMLAKVEYVKARRRLDGGAGGAALRHLKKALDLDPTFRPSYVLLAEILLAQQRVKEAVDLYGKVLAYDPTDSEALVGLARSFMFTGRLEEAKDALVDAVIFDRTDLEAWKNLYVLGAVQGFAIENHDAPELGITRKSHGRHYDLIVDESLRDCSMQATAWIVYASQRAVWRYEGKYKRSLGPGKYYRTYEEDVDCYMALAAAWKVLTQEDSTACESDYLEHLRDVSDGGYLVAHVLFDYVCLQDPAAARGFSLEIVERLREYVDRYVLIPGG